jgi:hypothetical protein
MKNLPIFPILLLVLLWVEYSESCSKHQEIKNYIFHDNKYEINFRTEKTVLENLKSFSGGREIS